MWLDRIVELCRDTMRNQIDPLFLFSREAQFSSVRCRLPYASQRSPASVFVARMNQSENRFVTDQRLPSQSAADLAKTSDAKSDSTWKRLRANAEVSKREGIPPSMLND